MVERKKKHKPFNANSRPSEFFQANTYKIFGTFLKVDKWAR